MIKLMKKNQEGQLFKVAVCHVSEVTENNHNEIDTCWIKYPDADGCARSMLVAMTFTEVLKAIEEGNSNVGLR